MNSTNSWVQDSSSLEITYASIEHEKSVRRSISTLHLQSDLTLTAIPPERIGIDGQYDHNGLAKRVFLRLQELFGIELVQNLRISQRGRVVILMGTLPDSAVVQSFPSLVEAILSVEGALFVETQGLHSSGKSTGFT
ncbi:hypothetical protein ACN4EG_03285 [Alkalinema pantanalense CENA528]|uniref:hypothetical protein n=1 Tax=Alkalinema pantanalense TaxID=1620705 RepID=UPI003D6E6EEE